MKDKLVILIAANRFPRFENASPPTSPVPRKMLTSLRRFLVRAAAGQDLSRARIQEQLGRTDIRAEIEEPVQRARDAIRRTISNPSQVEVILYEPQNRRLIGDGNDVERRVVMPAATPPIPVLACSKSCTRRHEGAAAPHEL